MQLHDIQELVGNPVGSGETAAPVGGVRLLDAPGLGRTVLRADEQAVLARSDDGDVVPVEAIAAERIDDLDGLVSDLEPWMEPESPCVQQHQNREHDEQHRQPERAAVPVDQVREERYHHSRGESEGRYEYECHRPGAPDASGPIIHRFSLYRHEVAPPGGPRSVAGQSPTLSRCPASQW